MRRTLIVGLVGVVMTAAFAAPAHADERASCGAVTTYTFVPMPPPWTPESLCAAKAALVDRTSLPGRDWMA